MAGLGERQYMGTGTGPMGTYINQTISSKVAFGDFGVRHGLAAASVCPHEGEITDKIDSIPSEKEEGCCKSTNG